MSTPNELPRSVQASWHGFLETYEPLRTDLYRYCRHLTRSPWDAEDLAQDALARAFRALTRVDPDGDRVARLQNYFFTPDLVAEVCGELGVPSRPNGYRWWLPSNAC